MKQYVLDACALLALLHNEKEPSALETCSKSKLSKHPKYFEMSKNLNGDGFAFGANTDVVDETRKNKGFFLFFTTDLRATPEDALYFFRAKDMAEKMFGQVKIDMGSGRARTLDEKKTNGKIFGTFITLAIEAYMLGRLNEHLSPKGMSLEKAFAQLENIHVVLANGKRALPKALTKEQKCILANFDAVDDLEKSLDSCLR
jgi:hypothetical protein